MTELFLMELTPYLTASGNGTEGGGRNTGFDMLQKRAAADGIAVERWDSQRMARCRRKQHAADQVRTLAAGILLQYGLRRRQTAMPEIAYTEQGKPLLIQGGVQISLSHAGMYAVCALSEQPVGVDVERVRRTNPRLRKSHWLTEPERTLLEQADGTEADALFCRMWTRMESRFKCCGTVTADGQELSYREYRIDGSEPYYVCICETGDEGGLPLHIWEVLPREEGFASHSLSAETAALRTVGTEAYEHPVLELTGE